MVAVVSIRLRDRHESRHRPRWRPGQEHFIEEIGRAVNTIKPGQFVIGSFFTSDNTCPTCQIGYQSSCQHRENISTAQAPFVRIPLADGTLVPTPDRPPDDLLPDLLTLSDVMGTGWFAADAANVTPGKTVLV